MFDVAPEPAQPPADDVLRRRGAWTSERGRGEECREIDAGVDRELQAAPAARVHFHQIRRPRAVVDLELDHRGSLPRCVAQQRFTSLGQVAIECRALREYHLAT